MARTFGTLELSHDRRNWIIDAEPHVSIRLKRWFESLKKTDVVRLTLSNTPEHAADLNLFLGRYPLKMDHWVQEELLASAAAFTHQMQMLERITQPHYRPRAMKLAVPARDYQRRGAEIHLACHGLLNADELGLGKTCSGICSFTHAPTLPALVVCPPHLQAQWREQIGMFMPSVFAHIIHKTQPYELPRAGGRGPDVLIISYHKLSAWAAVLIRYIKSVIWDEVHELRRDESGKYAAAAEIAKAVQWRLGLSATPIQNYGGEIFNVIECIRPGALGTWEEFAREWCDGFTDRTKAAVSDPPALGAYLREQFLMIRRTRTEVGRELPRLQKITHEVDCDTKILDQASDRASELARIILEKTSTERGEAMQAHGEFDNLMRQATGLAKAPYVAEFVKLLLAGGEKVLLFGWHRAVYEIWAERLKDYRVGWYTGSESPAQKQSVRERAICGEIDVMMISLRSGSGLDGLQRRFRTGVFGELDWSPGVHEQCTGRFYRDGQPDPVTAYYLVANDGADPIMSRVLGLKREQIDGLRDQKRDHLERLQRSEDHLKMLAERVLKGRR